MEKEIRKIPKIKICGITREAEAEYLNEFCIDYAGFVFYEKSKRNITLGQAEKIFEKLDPRIKKVAVTVSPDTKQIEMLNASGFDIIQIHKEFSPEILKVVKKPVWRAINISDAHSFEMLKCDEDKEGVLTGILVDAADFGSGKSFDWNEAEVFLHPGRRWRGMDFILAGGLKKENVAEGIRIFEPDIVDVSSGVEGENGKDRKRIEEFVSAVRK